MSLSDKAGMVLWMGICAIALGLVSCKSTGVNEADFPVPETPAGERQAVPQESPVTSVFLPGDQLELYVKEDPEFNGTYPVRSEGYILIPKLGRIQVEGYDRAGAERAFKRALEGGQLKTATVLVERRAGGGSGSPGSVEGDIRHAPKMRVYLTGQVKREGMHVVPMPGGRLPGLYEVLLGSGGLRDYANTKKVIVMRRDEDGRMQRREVNLERIQKGLEPDVSVGDGDIIEVPQRVFGF